MKKLLKVLTVIAVLVIMAAGAGYLYLRDNYMRHYVDEANRLVPAKIDDRVLSSIGSGVAFLTTRQSPKGAFVEGSLSPRIEITALAVQALSSLPPAFLSAQSPEYKSRLEQVVANAVKYIRTEGLKPDGGIYSDIPGFSVSVYGTAISLVTLRGLGYEENDPLIVSAQKYLLEAQHDEKGLYRGGFGYGKSSRPDLSNTTNALEALRASGLPQDSQAYKNAYEFISSTQNNSETNPSGLTVTDDGGFFYRPDPAGGDIILRDGRQAYASYGAMSYAGLVSFLYAGVDKADPRVVSAWRWVQSHYDLNENVNRKDIGLYYYYRIMAKALDVYGQRYITTPDGKRHDWAAELAETIIRLQRPDGSWVNDNTDFMEGDSVLVTSYALGVLEICFRNIKQN